MWYKYRLDRGHKVHQVTDEAKAQVTEEAKAAARRIAEKALAEKLQEIGMSEEDHNMYGEFLDPIKNDIANLRAALRAVEYKVSERDWIKRQLDGELDDSW
jgi:von Willebrand factor A domain-containing protein 8